MRRVTHAHYVEDNSTTKKRYVEVVPTAKMRSAATQQPPIGSNDVDFGSTARMRSVAAQPAVIASNNVEVVPTAKMRSAATQQPPIGSNDADVGSTAKMRSVATQQALIASNEMQMTHGHSTIGPTAKRRSVPTLPTLIASAGLQVVDVYRQGLKYFSGRDGLNGTMFVPRLRSMKSWQVGHFYEKAVRGCQCVTRHN